MVPRLVVHDAGGVTSSVSFDDALQLGRDATMGVVIADTKVSRHHATITRDAGEWVLIDAESRHGTFVNGSRVTRHVLRDGDQVQLGATILRFDIADDASAIAVSLDATVAPASIDERLRVFYQLAEATAAIDDPDAALGRALAAMVAVLGCDRGVIALGPVPQALRRAAEVSARDLVISRTVLDAVLKRGEALLVGGGELSASLDRQGVRSAIAAPLRSDKATLGLVYLDEHSRAERFSSHDLDLLVAVARLAGVIVDVASRYQRAVTLVEVAQADHVAPDLIGSSEQMRQLRREIERFAAAELPIHLVGESGVGKELVARAIHTGSPRRAAAFVAVNCAAMPDTLLESELFGHVRGAFTGADKSRRGKLALADRGTLFLDEIADLSLAAQAKLLRVLEDGEVVPVGSETALRVDVRVVSATHKDLKHAVAAGTFRQDLYYRVVGAEIAIPPLRERGADAIEIAEKFLAHIRSKRSAPARLSQEAIAAIASYPWPGNVRELRHAIERACAIASGDTIDAADLALPAASSKPAKSGSLASQFAALDETERRLVKQAMTEASGNVSEAARLLGISRVMMKRRLERYEEDEK